MFNEENEENKKIFEEFKQGLMLENEKKFGDEIREKYQQEDIENADKKFLELDQESYCQMEELNKKISKKLKEISKEKVTCNKSLVELAKLHKKWLSYTWANYSPSSHLWLAKMYLGDERFKKYYDDITSGGAEIMYKAISYAVENNEL